MDDRINVQTSPGTAGVCGASSETIYMTLGQAGQGLPGRPSACTIWRWCRKGIRSRGGDRIKLKHVRLGGRIMTTAEAVADFGQRLATADSAHFDKRADSPLPPRDAAYGPPSGRGGRRSRQRAVVDNSRNTEIERDLDEEGL